MKNKLILLIMVVTLFSTVSVHALNYNIVPMLDDSPAVNVGCEAISGGLTDWLKNAFTIIRFAGVGLAIILTALDFIGVVGGSKEDDLKKAFDKTIKRIVALILLLLTTVIVDLIITFVNPIVSKDNPSIPNCSDKI